jgi:hypothetical protein
MSRSPVSSPIPSVPSPTVTAPKATTAAPKTGTQSNVNTGPSTTPETVAAIIALIVVILFLIALTVFFWYFNRARQCYSPPSIQCYTDWLCPNEVDPNRKNPATTIPKIMAACALANLQKSCPNNYCSSPATITGVTAVGGVGTITVNWTAASGTVVNYYVYLRNTTEGPVTRIFYDQVLTIPSGTTTASFTSLSAGTYEIVVTQTQNVPSSTAPNDNTTCLGESQQSTTQTVVVT